jgi:hypothetical protein
MNSHYYNLGGHIVSLTFEGSSDVNNMSLLPAFSTFRCQPPTLPPMLTLTVDDSTPQARGRKLLRTFDTGNGDIAVYMLPDGGYQFIIRNIEGSDCCLLLADRRFSNCRCALNGDYSMRAFGLNNAMMMAYAFAASYRQTILIHASTVMLPHPHGHDMPLALPFVAASGTGKSTHTSLWLKNIDHAQLLNDDNLIIRIVNSQPHAYGSPWSGKTPCYRRREALLGAVTRVERAKADSMERLSTLAAFASLLPSCSNMKWDEAINQNVCGVIAAVIEAVPQFTVHCLPDDQAALTAHKAIMEEWKRK